MDIRTLDEGNTFKFDNPDDDESSKRGNDSRDDENFEESEWVAFDDPNAPPVKDDENIDENIPAIRLEDVFSTPSGNPAPPVEDDENTDENIPAIRDDFIAMDGTENLPDGSLNVVLEAEGLTPVEEEVDCPLEKSFTLYSLVNTALDQDAKRYENPDWALRYTRELHELRYTRELHEKVELCKNELESEKYRISRKIVQTKSGSALTYGYRPDKNLLGENRPIFTDEQTGLRIRVWFMRLDKDQMSD